MTELGFPVRGTGSVQQQQRQYPQNDGKHAARHDALDGSQIGPLDGGNAASADLAHFANSGDGWSLAAVDAGRIGAARTPFLCGFNFVDFPPAGIDLRQPG